MGGVVEIEGGGQHGGRRRHGIGQAEGALGDAVGQDARDLGLQLVDMGGRGAGRLDRQGVVGREQFGVVVDLAPLGLGQGQDPVFQPLFRRFGAGTNSDCMLDIVLAATTLGRGLMLLVVLGAVLACSCCRTARRLLTT